MEEPKGIDKRSKEYRKYKEWKAKFEAEQEAKPEGVGDVVEKVLDSKVMKPITEAVKSLIWKDNEDCGCEERKKKLNEIFNFHKPNCLEEDEFTYLDKFFSVRRTQVKHSDKLRLYEVYNRVFSTELEPSNCPSCLSAMIRKLRTIKNTYE